MRIQESQNSSTSGVTNAINLNKRACIENRVVGTGIQEQVRRRKVKQIKKYQLSPKLT